MMDPKLLLSTLMLGLTVSLGVAACDDKKDIGDDIEDAADDIEDKVEDAVDDH